MTLMSIHQEARYLGKRTPKGIVVRRVKPGEDTRSFFVGQRGISEMIDGKFLPVSDEMAQTITMFANRVE